MLTYLSHASKTIYILLCEKYYTQEVEIPKQIINSALSLLSSLLVHAEKHIITYSRFLATNNHQVHQQTPLSSSLNSPLHHVDKPSEAHQLPYPYYNAVEFNAHNQPIQTDSFFFNGQPLHHSSTYPFPWQAPPGTNQQGVAQQNFIGISIAVMSVGCILGVLFIIRSILRTQLMQKIQTISEKQSAVIKEIKTIDEQFIQIKKVATQIDITDKENLANISPMNKLLYSLKALETVITDQAEKQSIEAIKTMLNRLKTTLNLYRGHDSLTGRLALMQKTMDNLKNLSNHMLQASTGMKELCKIIKEKKLIE